MSVKKMKQFDDYIREAFDGHQAPYKPKAWNKLEAGLAGKLGGFSSSLKIASAVAVIAASGLGLIYFNSSDAEIIVSAEGASVKTTLREVETPIITENIEHAVELKEDILVAKNEIKATEESVLLDANSTTPLASNNISAPLASKVSPPKIPKQVLPILSRSACMGELVEFSIDTDKSVVWEFGDGKVQHGTSVAHRYSQSGVFVAQASIVNESDQTMELVKSSELRINEIPNPDFAFEPPCDGDQGSMGFDAANAEFQNIWKLGDGSILEGAHVEHVLVKRGFFKAKHIVENEFGCKDSVTKRIAVNCTFNLLAPKLFNPSQGGWFPIGLKKGDLAFDLKVIDAAAGGIAFQSSNAKDEWNGIVAHSGKKTKGGQSYLWIAVVTDANGKISEFGGDIQIVDSE